MGIQQYREQLDRRDLQAAAKAELGKIGHTFNFAFNSGDRREQLGQRADARRAINAIQATIDKQKPETLTDAKVSALEYLGAWVGVLNAELEIQDFSESFATGGAGHTLRDSDGRRIGTVLSKDELRNAGSIAVAMKVGPGNEGLDLANFVRGVANMKTSEGVRNALTEGTNTAGGYTVPTVLLPGILGALAPASSLIQAGASVALLQDKAKSFNIAGVDALPTAAWRNESGAVATSDPAFRSITITPRSLAFQFKVSRELLADAPGIEDALRQVIAQAFAKELDRAGLRGSGTAPEVRGLLNTPGISTIANGANGASLATLKFTKMINARRLMKDLNAPSPSAVIISPRDDETIANFADSTGQPLRRPESLQDWQFVTTSQIPTNLTVGTSTDCSEMYVGDFTQFGFFMREGVSLQLANELYAGTGEIGFICHTRVDVAAIYPQAFAVITGIRP